MQKDAQNIKRRLVEHYDDDAPAYHRGNYGDETDYLPLEFRQAYVEDMIDGLDLAPGSRILDVGCGPGELFLSLTRKGFTVWGVDISAGMIAEASELLAREGIDCGDRLAVGDIEKLDFEDGFFDVVVAAGVIEYQENDGRALAEMNRVLKVGGHVVLNVTNRFGYLNWIDEPYRWLKKKRSTRAAMSFLKERLLGKGSLNDLPDRRTHRPRRFDATLRQHGFAKRGHNYFHFSPLPMPLDSVFAKACKPLGKRMEGLTRHPAGKALGGGYIVVAAKEA